jgi:hypothetical protein
VSDGPLYLIDGATELRGPRALWWVARRWPPLRRELTGAPGYVAHRLWYVFPFTVGLTTWWSEERAAYRFAHMPVHLKFWSWAARGRSTRGGWLATYRFERGGPLWGNGVEAMMKRFGPFVDAPLHEPPRATPADRRTERK